MLFIDNDLEIPRTYLLGPTGFYFYSMRYYIHRVNLYYSILDSGGNYVSSGSEDLGYSMQMKVSVDADEYLREVDASLKWLVKLLDLVDVIDEFLPLPGYFEDALSVVELALAWVSTNSQYSDSGCIPFDDITQQAYWETSYNTGILGDRPYYSDEEMSLQCRWTPKLETTNRGVYQIQLRYEVELHKLYLYEYQSPLQYVYSHMPHCVISGTSYFNVDFQ